MKMVSFNFPFRKALLTSIGCTFKSSEATMASMVWMDANLATNANVFEKFVQGV